MRGPLEGIRVFDLTLIMVGPWTTMNLGALGADDPLLFGRRLVRQYEIARDVHGFSPYELADRASISVPGSAAPDSFRLPAQHAAEP